MATKEKLEQEAGKVLYPDPIRYDFLGREIGILPLPVFYAKRVSRRLAGVRERVLLIQKKVEQGGIEPILDEVDREIDAEFAEALVDCVMIMIEFYQSKNPSLAITREEVEQTATIAQITDFVTKQVEVNGTSDFLLQPLSMASLFAHGTKILWEAYQNLQSSAASVRLGESPLTS